MNLSQPPAPPAPAPARPPLVKVLGSVVLAVAVLFFVFGFSTSGGSFGEPCSVKNACFGLKFQAKCMKGKYVESPSYCTHTCATDADCSGKGWSCQPSESGGNLCVK